MGRLTTSTNQFLSAVAAAGLLTIGTVASAQSVDESTVGRSSATPLIYDSAPLSTRSVDIDFSDRLKVQLLTPADDVGYSQTSGIWRPVDSVELRAGYGISPNSVAELGACAQDGCTASVEDAPVETYSLGASWQFSNALNLNVDYLSRQSENRSVANAPWLSNAHGALNLGNSEAIDFSLVCDINAGNWGDLELGLQVSRVINSDYDLIGETSDSAPLNSAALGLGWQKGAFRTDLTSRYLDLLDEGAQAAGWTSFDINFAWRMPWNARVSVGARNVLNNPAPQTNNLSDAEVENFFGRVPYVRYQQDL